MPQTKLNSWESCFRMSRFRTFTVLDCVVYIIGNCIFSNQINIIKFILFDPPFGEQFCTQDKVMFWQKRLRAMKVCSNCLNYKYIYCGVLSTALFLKKLKGVTLNQDATMWIKQPRSNYFLVVNQMLLCIRNQLEEH